MRTQADLLLAILTIIVAVGLAVVELTVPELTLMLQWFFNLMGVPAVILPFFSAWVAVQLHARAAGINWQVIYLFAVSFLLLLNLFKFNLTGH